MDKKNIKIKLKLKSYDHVILDNAIKRIVESVESTGARVLGPIPLPTKKEVFCVLRSPHIDKKSREHFEIRTHKRLLYILDANSSTVDSILHMKLASGLEVELKYN